jgi:hypothetical protein
MGAFRLKARKHYAHSHLKHNISGHSTSSARCRGRKQLFNDLSAVALFDDSTAALWRASKAGRLSPPFAPLMRWSL